LRTKRIGARRKQVRCCSLGDWIGPLTLSLSLSFPSDAEALAAKWGGTYFECSSAREEGIREVFNGVIRELAKANVAPVPPTSYETEGLDAALAAARAKGERTLGKFDVFASILLTLCLCSSGPADALQPAKSGGGWEETPKGEKKGVTKKVSGLFKKKKKSKKDE
jgi:hypothetical protein